jgi:hypothetical protein
LPDEVIYPEEIESWNDFNQNETKTTYSSPCWILCSSSWSDMVSARRSTSSPMSCVMYNELRMCHWWIRVLGSSRSDYAKYNDSI